MNIDPRNVVELTSDYRLTDGSPWSPRWFAHEAWLADGRVAALAEKRRRARR